MKSFQIKTVILAAVVGCIFGSSAFAQLIPKGVTNALDKANAKLKDVELTEQEEIQLGEQISAKVRAKYGVVQDADVHKYVTLVGTALAAKSTRSTLAWHFIVLDTDGVNAFAAPGGYVHITRGALALAKSEAELAGVLAHELIHVTNKHTMKAIQKNKLVQMGANETNVSSNPELFRRIVDEGFNVVFAGFGRAEELEADAAGVALAAKAGYMPNGLQKVLLTLNDRNKDSDQKQGLFASHPEMSERLDKLAAAIGKDTPALAVLADRYGAHIKYQPVPLASIAVVADGTAGLAGGAAPKDDKKEEVKKPSRFSLSNLKNSVAGGTETKQSASVTGSGGSRGVDKERSAKGGSNANVVPIVLTAAEVSDFIKEGKLAT